MLESADTIALVATSTPLNTPPLPLTVKQLVTQEFPEAPVMLRICEAESDCTPTAKSPTSSATGLFQILIGTWKWYDCGPLASRTVATSSIACARKIYDAQGTVPWNSSKANWE